MKKAGAQPHVDTFRFSRPVVLSAIGGHGDTHAFQRTHEEHFDAHAGGEGGHARRTQGVVCALEHDAPMAVIENCSPIGTPMSNSPFM